MKIKEKRMRDRELKILAAVIVIFLISLVVGRTAVA